MNYLKIFTDFAETVSLLDDAEVGRLFRAMLRYAADADVVTLPGNERFLWPVAKQNVDRERETYDRVCERNRKNRTGADSADAQKTRKNCPKPGSFDVASRHVQDKDKDKEKKETLSEERVRKSTAGVVTTACAPGDAAAALSCKTDTVRFDGRETERTVTAESVGSAALAYPEETEKMRTYPEPDAPDGVEYPEQTAVADGIEYPEEADAWEIAPDEQDGGCRELPDGMKDADPASFGGSPSACKASPIPASAEGSASVGGASVPQSRIGDGVPAPQTRARNREARSSDIPALPEVIDFCNRRGLAVDPEHFFRYYEVSGWRDGNDRPVCSWRQKLLTWDSYEHARGRSASPDKPTRSTSKPGMGSRANYHQNLLNDEQLAALFVDLDGAEAAG